MTREETAEWVGYYFGLQRAGNMRVMVIGEPLATGAGIAINKLRGLIDAEMAKVLAKLPDGTIEAWPNVTASTSH